MANIEKSSIYVPAELRDRIRFIAANEQRKIIDVLNRMVDLYTCDPFTYLTLQKVQRSRNLPTTGDAITNIVTEWSRFTSEHVAGEQNIQPA